MILARNCVREDHLGFLWCHIYNTSTWYYRGANSLYTVIYENPIPDTPTTVTHECTAHRKKNMCFNFCQVYTFSNKNDNMPITCTTARPPALTPAQHFSFDLVG